MRQRIFLSLPYILLGGFLVLLMRISSYLCEIIGSDIGYVDAVLLIIFCLSSLYGSVAKVRKLYLAGWVFVLAAFLIGINHVSYQDADPGKMDLIRNLGKDLLKASFTGSVLLNVAIYLEYLMQRTDKPVE